MDDNKVELQTSKEHYETTPSAESRDKSHELDIEGANMLENPPDGNFMHGLQIFIAWVSRLITKQDDN